MAEKLGMTVQQFLHNTTAEEIGIWMALELEEQKRSRLQSLAAKADSLLRRR